MTKNWVMLLTHMPSLFDCMCLCRSKRMEWGWWKRRVIKRRASRSQRWCMRPTATGKVAAGSLTPKSSLCMWVDTTFMFHQFSLLIESFMIRLSNGWKRNTYIHKHLKILHLASDIPFVTATPKLNQRVKNNIKAHFLWRYTTVPFNHFSLDNTHSHSLTTLFSYNPHKHTHSKKHTPTPKTSDINIPSSPRLSFPTLTWQSMAAVLTPIYNWKPPVGMACLPHLKSCPQSLKILTTSCLCHWKSDIGTCCCF